MSNNKKKMKTTSLRITVIVCFVLVTVLAAFAASVGGLSKKVSFPVSPLSKLNDGAHRYYSDYELNTTIKSPSLPVILNVKGDETTVFEDGCVFLTKDYFYISVYETTSSPVEILNSRFCDNLTGVNTNTPCTYNAVNNSIDVGYFNGYPAEYQAGTVTWKPETLEAYRLYVVSLTFNLGYDKKIMVAVSTRDGDKTYDAENLLESICLSMMDISESKTAQTSIKNETPTKTPVEDIKEEAIAPTGSINAVVIDESSDSTGEVTYSIYVNEEFPSGTGLAFKYSNPSADTGKIYVIDPSGKVLLPDELFSGYGVLFFKSEESVKGEWVLKIPAQNSLGDYSLKAYDLDNMTRIFNLY
jgi:hypothetical protein